MEFNMNDVSTKIFKYLKTRQMTYADYTEEEIHSLLYSGNIDERLDILKWITIEIDNRYEVGLQKSDNLKIDLANILSNLEFVSSSKKILFVEGKLSLKEQEDVMRNIFRCLSLILFTNETERDIDLTETNYILNGKKSSKLKDNKGFKLDLDKAWKNVENVRTALCDMAENQEQETEDFNEPASSKPMENLSEDTMAKYQEVTSEFCEKFNNIKPLVGNTSEELNKDLENPQYLENVIEKMNTALNDMLKTYTEVSQNDLVSTIVIDSNNHLEKLKAYTENSNVRKLI